MLKCSTHSNKKCPMSSPYSISTTSRVSIRYAPGDVGVFNLKRVDSSAGVVQRHQGPLVGLAQAEPEPHIFCYRLVNMGGQGRHSLGRQVDQLGELAHDHGGRGVFLGRHALGSSVFVGIVGLGSQCNCNCNWNWSWNWDSADLASSTSTTENTMVKKRA